MRCSQVRLAALCMGLTLILATQALALPSFRYDPANTAYVSDELEFPLTLLWKHSTELIEDPIIASPVVGPDAVYFCVEKKVIALDRLTGDVKWEFEPRTKLFSAPVLHEGKLYFGGQDSNLWVLNASTGQPEWTFKVGGPIDCPPLIVGNMLYIGSDDDSLHAIDITQQGQVWAFGTRGDIKAAPAFSRGNIFVASRDEYLYCLDTNGAQRWRAKLRGGDNFSAPVVDGDKGLVFVASGQSLHCFDAATKNARWKPFSAGDLIVGSGALAPDRKLYVGSKDGAVYCISTLDGRALWKYPHGEGRSIEPILSSPTVLGGNTVLVRTGEKLVAALDSQSGDLKWEYRLATPPEKKKETATGATGASGLMGPGGAGGMGPGGMGGGMMMPGGAGGAMGGGAGGAGGEGGAMAPGATGGAGGAGRRGGNRGGGGLGGNTTVEIKPAEFDENLRASITVADGGLYVLGDRGDLYAFDPNALDAAPPQTNEAILDITGTEDYHFIYGLTVLGGDEPASRDAELLVVPGRPPITFMFKVIDEGSGVDPESIRLTMNGKQIEHEYDSKESVIKHVLDPEYGPARPLPNGALNFVVKFKDWHGNQAVAQASFTVDNSLPPLENKAAATGGGGMMPGGMGPGGMGGEMMGPGMMMGPGQ